jgi:hypothetical protein
MVEARNAIATLLDNGARKLRTLTNPLGFVQEA